MLLRWSWLSLFAAAGSCLTDCGGVLKERRGIISTPAFPRPFQLPIRCRWLLDGTNWEEEEGAGLGVYLSQMYLSSGVRFTEYDYFDPADPSLQRNPRLLLSLTEENSVSSRWIFTRSKFLLIELELDRLEGNHLRALDHLLDVFGFNITYEMAASRIRNDTCSVLDCSLAGNCYVSIDFREFWCSCFPGFSGANCELGPVCRSSSNPCQNGAVCRQIGIYPKCTCKDGFTGEHCESQLLHSGCDGTEGEEEEGCNSQCRFDGRDENVCNCATAGKRIHGDRWRYVVRLSLANISNLMSQHPEHTLYNYLEKQDLFSLGGKSSVNDLKMERTAPTNLFSHKYTVFIQQLGGQKWFHKQLILRAIRPLSLSRFEDLLILNVSESGEVEFQLFSERHELLRLREGLKRLEERQRLGEVPLTPGSRIQLNHDHGLQLVTLSMNSPVARKGEQVILSCIAQGSDQIVFNWYKDGHLVDDRQPSRGVWKKYLPQNSKGEYTGILVIEAVEAADEGSYTCQAVDWRVQECRSRSLRVLREPELEVQPMTAFIRKGDDIILKCVSPSKKVWYSWTRERSLFPMQPGREVWENLEPWGSILRASNIQKSVTYTCHAHTSTAKSEKYIKIYILSENHCPKKNLSGIIWAETSAGSTSLSHCPQSHTGYASRSCTTKGPGETDWQEPDFSNCISKKLGGLIHDFGQISRGYMKTSLLFLLSDLYSWFRGRTVRLRGEGESVLHFLTTVFDYLRENIARKEILKLIKVFLANIDLILTESESILHHENVGKLQILVNKWALLWIGCSNSSSEHLAYDEFVVNVVKLTKSSKELHQIPPTLPYRSHSVYPRWYTTKIAVDIMGPPGDPPSPVVILNYRNITRFLPKVSTQIMPDGSELTYELPSNMVCISSEDGRSSSSLRLEITLPIGTAGSAGGSDWKVYCGRASHLSADWDLSVCRQLTTTANYTSCQCQGTGVYAALRTRQAKSEIGREGEASELKSSLVVVGCSCCLAQSLITLLLLLVKWFPQRSCTLFFKIQMSFSVTSIMCIVVYAVRIQPKKDTLHLLAIASEFLFFLGLCSHIGILLIIYTEVTYFPNPMIPKYTVFGLMAGVAILTTLLSLLVERLSQREPDNGSWGHHWLLAGSGGFYPCLISAVLLLVLYLLLLSTLVARLSSLLTGKAELSLRTRLGLVTRTTVLFITFNSTAIWAVVFINLPNRTNSYICTSLAAVLGSLIFICYIICAESTFKLKFNKNDIKLGKDLEFGSDAEYNLFSFFMKGEAEFESESAPTRLKKCEQAIPLKKVSSQLSENHLPGAFYEKSKEIKYSGERHRNMEEYPEVSEAHPKVSVEVENSTEPSLVPKVEVQNYDLCLVDSTSEAGDSTSCRDISSQISPTEVLNSISEDLDYLLNRRNPGLLRPNSALKVVKNRKMETFCDKGEKLNENSHICKAH